MSEVGPGVMIGTYQLSFQLGKGGMGQVWAAEQIADGRKRMLALKILPSSMLEAKLRSLFLDEARVARALSHPCIVSASDVGSDGDLLYMAMELVRGPSLSVLLQRLVQTNRTLAPECLVSVGLDLLDALAYAHEEATVGERALRLIHRDVSPHNVLVRPGGAVALADFGVARSALQMHETSAGTVRGKPAYMSPEQVASSDLDARSDLFSLGVVLYELAVRRRLFGRKNLLLTMQAVTGFEPPPISQYRPDLSPGLQRVIHRLLEKKPEARFQSAREARDALEAASSASDPLNGRRALWEAVVATLPEDAFSATKDAERAIASAPDTEPDARPMGADPSSASIASPLGATSSRSSVVWPSIAAGHPLDDAAMTQAGWHAVFDDLEVKRAPAAGEQRNFPSPRPSSSPVRSEPAPPRLVALDRSFPHRPSAAPPHRSKRSSPPPTVTSEPNRKMTWLLGASVVGLGLLALLRGPSGTTPEPLDSDLTTTRVSREGSERSPSIATTAGGLVPKSKAAAASSSPGAPAVDSNPTQAEEDEETHFRRLIMAAENGDVGAIKRGIRAGIGLDRKDERGWTILHVAAYRGKSEVVETLLSAGADPNEPAAEGWTPLHLAAQGGHVDSASSLLLHGAKAAANTNEGETPMHIVASSKPGNADRLISLFFRHGARGTEVDGQGFSPVDAAVSHDCVTCMEGFYRVRAPLNEKAPDGATPLWRAAYLGRQAIVKSLLSRGAAAPAVEGVSASEIARQKGYAEVARLLAEQGQ